MIYIIAFVFMEICAFVAALAVRLAGFLIRDARGDPEGYKTEGFIAAFTDGMVALGVAYLPFSWFSTEINYWIIIPVFACISYGAISAQPRESFIPKRYFDKWSQVAGLILSILAFSVIKFAF